jgi:predicted phage terminase large subunit-like protein
MFDQLEHFSSHMFFYLLSRNRTDCGIRAYCRATCNPDPDSWLATFLDWWIDEQGFPIEDRAGIVRYYTRRDNEIAWADTSEELSEDPNLIKSATFIYSLPDDNPIGMALNPGYVGDLEALPYYLKMQRRYGNWKARPEAGKVINRSWFNVQETAAHVADAEAILFWDFAATAKSVAKSDPDYTAAVFMLKQRPLCVGDQVFPPRFLVANCFAEQLAPADVNKELVRFSWQCHAWCTAHSVRSFKVRWEIEPGSAGIMLAQQYMAMLAGLDALGVRSVKDKLTRALAFVTQAKARNVDVLRGDWNDRYLNELHNFPEVAHDDVWDANSGAFNGLSHETPDPQVVRESMQSTPSRWSTSKQTGSRWKR